MATEGILMDHSDLLSAHHVGGRGGDRRFPILESFEPDVVNVLFDGDTAAADTMRDSTAKLLSKQLPLSYCLGSKPGAATLYVYKLSAGSSMLTIDSSFFRSFEALGAITFDMGANEFSIDHELAVDVTTLDSCVLEKGVPAPDFLSINTQGTELEIIRGAARVLEQHATVIQCEVTFFSLYEGQNSLDDLCRHLHASGYWLCALVPHTPYVPTIMVGEQRLGPPVGFRRGGICLQAEAIFFKDPRRILSGHREANIDLAKSVYMSIVLGNYSMAYNYAVLVDPTRLPDTCSHLRFARAFASAARTEPRVRVPDVLSLNSGQAKRWYEDSNSREVFDRYADVLRSEHYTDTEQVCMDFGFKSAADNMREYRIASIGVLRKELS
jgi:FkbM family methyltransferase